MTTTAASPSIPLTIWNRLRQVRSRLRLWVVLDGLVRVLALVLLLCAVDFVLDYFFHLDRAQRIIMLLLGLGLVAWVAWKKLFTPLRVDLSDDAIVRQVEAANPDVGESLITTVEFAREDWSQRSDVSRSMIDHTIEKGTEAAKALDFERIIDAKSLGQNRAKLAVLGLLLLALVFGVAANPLLGTWFNRNVLLGHQQWPLSYYLEVQGLENGKLIMPRGDDWTLQARLSESSRSAPDSATVEIRTNSGTRKERMDRMEKGQLFQRPLRQVFDPFTFRIVSGKFETRWIEVELVDRPAVATIEVSTTPPDYTQIKVHQLPPEQSPWRILEGSSIDLRGAASKPLSRAEITVGDQRHEVQVDGTAFSCTLPPAALQNGTYALHLWDQEQVYQARLNTTGPLESSQPTRFTLRVQPDRKPEARMKLLGIGNLVAPRARMPFAGSVRDDFSVEETSIVHRFRNDTEGTSSEGVFDIPGIEEKLGQPELNFDGFLDLEQLDPTIGSSLTLFVEAIDNNTVSGPLVGESAKFLIRVVSEAELRADLLRREKEQRQAIERASKQQDILLTETEAFSASTSSTPELNAATQNQLLQLQKRQKTIAPILQRASERLAMLLLEAENNRIEDDREVLRKRLEDNVIKPLEFLAKNQLPTVVQHMDTAWRQATEAETRQTALQQAISGQQAAMGSLKRILASMVSNAEFQEAVNLLLEIEQSQAELKEKTEKEKQDRINQLLNQGTEHAP